VVGCGRQMVARAMARKGTALEKSGDMEGAIAMYNKALTEHRSADVLNKLRACEALLKKKTEEAYFDVDKANEEKEKGNEHFKASRVRGTSCGLRRAAGAPSADTT
jgi:stress-induced-phosphoprotein 1